MLAGGLLGPKAGKHREAGGPRGVLQSTSCLLMFSLQGGTEILPASNWKNRLSLVRFWKSGRTCQNRARDPLSHAPHSLPSSAPSSLLVFVSSLPPSPPATLATLLFTKQDGHASTPGPLHLLFSLVRKSSAHDFSICPSHKIHPQDHLLWIFPWTPLRIGCCSSAPQAFCAQIC